jgi:hypothetical protein
MKLGIVGHEARKFTPRTKILAAVEIRVLFEHYHPDLVISGHSPLGGIDWWAIALAKRCGIETLEYPPKRPGWEGGYRERNLEIARASDAVVCIVVKQLPQGYQGMRFPLCYHCKATDHVKSGGCWTMKQAAALGKQTELVVIE